MTLAELGLYVRDAYERLAERRRVAGDGPAYRDGGYDPPSREELLDTPWGGDGDDPLERLWEAS